MGEALAVVGSRGFRDARKLAEVLAARAPAVVISGGAKGADQLAETWARRNDIPTQIFGDYIFDKPNAVRIGSGT